MSHPLTFMANPRVASADLANAVVVSFTADRRITLWNTEAERVFGWTRDDVRGRPVEDVMTGDGAEPIAEAIRRVESGAPLWMYEAGRRARDGSLRVLLCVLTRAWDAEADFTVVAHDITRRADAEQRLRLREAALMDAQYLAQVGSWLYDLHTGDVTWSEELFRIAGLPAGSAAPGWDQQGRLYADDGWARLNDAVEGAREGQPFELEVEMVRPGGERRGIVARGAAIRDEAGRVVRLHGTVQDVTDRRRAHRLLEEGEQRFRLMTSAIQDVFWMRTRRESRQLYVSPAYETIWGRALETAYASPEGFLDAVHPDDRARVRHATLENWQAPFEVDYRIVRPDGEVRWIRDRGYPVLDASGDAHMMTGVASDITKLQQQEAMLQAVNQRLERSERRYRDLVENLNDVVFALDNDRVIEYVSPAVQKYGYTPGDLIGKPFWVVVHPDDVPVLEQALSQPDRDPTAPYEFRAIGKTGDVHYVRSSSRDVFEGDRLVGVTGVLIDLTEQRRAEEQLRVSQRLDALGRLAGGVAHDFNNLLVAIIGYAEFALDGVREGDPMRSDIEEILKAGHRAASLTHQLLAFSRKQVLQPELINLNDVVGSMEGMLRRLIGEDIDLQTTLADGLAPVLADPGQIEQVIMNLVVNARDAMPRGGRLSLETANRDTPIESDDVARPQHGGWVVLTVRDTGIGMDAQTKARLFEPFFTTKPQGEGTGLGLPTVYGIVRQSGGAIAVESEPGRGAAFRIAFPREASAAGAVAPRGRLATANRGTETVLIVEDEESVRHLARRFLGAAGYNVLAAANGGEALLTCERHEGPIHLLLTDVVMPHMSGRELAERLALIRPEMRVLYMSGYTGDVIDHHHRGLAQGIHLVEKPFSGADLARRVRSLLDEPA